MCGICGDVDLARMPDAEAVWRMTGALAHRGPDAHGFFFEGPAALGHRRLSILDIEGGVQPMTADGVTLLFNGQAYEHDEVRARLRRRGHSFATRSDTEVVLRSYLEWGERFVEELHGMFAIALWDARNQKLVLARERLGILHRALRAAQPLRVRERAEGVRRPRRRSPRTGRGIARPVPRRRIRSRAPQHPPPRLQAAGGARSGPRRSGIPALTLLGASCTGPVRRDARGSGQRARR